MAKWKPRCEGSKNWRKKRNLKSLVRNKNSGTRKKNKKPSLGTVEQFILDLGVPVAFCVMFQRFVNFDSLVSFL